MSSHGFIKCIADPTRLQILQLLRSGEKCVCEIVKDLSREQSLVSHHLQSLKSCRLVKSRYEGKKVFYRIQDPLIVKLLDLLNTIADKKYCKGRANE